MSEHRPPTAQPQKLLRRAISGEQCRLWAATRDAPMNSRARAVTAVAVPTNCRLLTIYTSTASNRKHVQDRAHRTIRYAQSAAAARRHHRAGAVEFAADAGAEGARAHDPRRRPRRRRQAQRSRDRRTRSASRADRCAKRFARSRNRAWCAWKRIAACSCARSASRKPTKSTRCVRRSTNGSAGASRRPRRPSRLESLRSFVERMDRAAAQDDVEAY